MNATFSRLLNYQHLPAKTPAHHAPIMFLHGLFGYGRNWLSIARQFSEYSCILPDLRNHGQSFHDDDFSLSAMAKDIENLRQHLGWDRFHLVGHSLGGKVAMQYAHDFGLGLASLSVLDIAPRPYDLSEHKALIEALQRLDLSRIHRRHDADEALQVEIPNAMVRRFLLSNLRQVEHQTETANKKTSPWVWQMNLERMAQDLDTLKAAPNASHPTPRLFTRCPVQFIGGANSDYMPKSDHEVIFTQFPDAQVHWIDQAGHWLHVEQPEALIKKIKDFLNTP